MKNLQERIKSLTPEQCVAISSLAVPNVNWKFTASVNTWNGFDLIEPNDIGESLFSHIFQIDYRDDAESIFRYYVDSTHTCYPSGFFKVFDYLESISHGIEN